MIELKPYYAWRYNLKAVDTLKNVVSLPYDKISDKHQIELLERHPYNVVRLIKPPVQEGDHPETDPYKRAAKCWDDWRREGILVQDEVPTLTLYTQRGPLPGGGTFVRYCIQSLVKITPYGPNGIRRHEQTLAKPLSDRLKLLQSTKANLGHIFGLYPDEDQKAWEMLQEQISREPYASSVDEDGVIHSVTVIDDESWIRRFCDLFGSKYLIIADGHHRYETSMRYREECLSAGGGEKDGFNYVMMSLCGMTHPGLTILATHRVLRKTNLSDEQIEAGLAKIFDITPVANFDELVAKSTRGASTTLGWYTKSGQCRVLSLKADGWSQHPRASDFSEAERGLSVSILHKLVIEHTLGFTEEEVRQEQVLSYVRLPEEGLEIIAKDNAPGMFLLPPTSIEQVADITNLNKVMPQKSTDFYPKVWSGFTFRDVTEAPNT